MIRWEAETDNHLDIYELATPIHRVAMEKREILPGARWEKRGDTKNHPLTSRTCTVA